MTDKKFTSGIGTVAKAAFKRAFWITFVIGLVCISIFGDIEEMLFAIFWITLLGAFFWEFTHTVAVEVRSDGISVSYFASEPVIYKYEKYYIAPKGRLTLLIEDRKLSRSEEIICRGFSSSEFDKCSKLIKARQDEFFVRRAMKNDVGAEPESRNEAQNKGQSAAQRAVAAKRASASAASRNPYAKGNGASKGRNSSASMSASTAASTTITIVKPEGLELPKPPTIDELPTVEPLRTDVIVSIPESPGIADLPKTSDFDEFVAKKPKPSAHEHGEDFNKKVFYYPRRNIVDSSERIMTMTLLSTLAISIAIFLALYILAPQYLAAEATLLVIICAGIIGYTSISNRIKLSGIPSKLEITESYLIIDNTRYRFRELSEMTMTAPDKKSGIRSIRFVFDAKTVVCRLGPAVKTERNSEGYFNRYDELFEALSEKGFRRCL